MRPVVAREKAARMYPGWMQSVAMCIVEIPYLLVSGVLSALVFYSLTGLSGDAEHIVLYFLAHTLLGFLLAYLSHFVSYVFATADIATLAASSIVSLMFLFGGVFVPGPGMPPGYKWIWYANFLRHALTTMVVPQFYCDAPANATGACPTIDFATADGTVELRTSDYVEDFLGVNYENRWESLFAAIGYTVGFLICALLAARYINHVKR